jgi:hypothetical protein
MKKITEPEDNQASFLLVTENLQALILLCSSELRLHPWVSPQPPVCWLNIKRDTSKADIIRLET